MTRRVLLTSASLAVSKPSYDVVGLDAVDDADKLAFHSDWTRIEEVHQSGEVAITQQSPAGGAVGSWIPFPALSYRPMVTLRRKPSAGSNQFLADEWRFVNTGGDDPYFSRICISVEQHGFVVRSRAIQSPQFAQGLSSGTFYVSYIVWKIPANAVLVV